MELEVETMEDNHTFSLRTMRDYHTISGKTPYPAGGGDGGVENYFLP